MAFSGCMIPAMAEQHVGFRSDPTATESPLLPTQPVATVSVVAWPEVDAAAAAEGVEKRSFRRRIANRESARRSRARKLRHLDELRDSAALLESENRDLAARAEAVHARLVLSLLANAALRAEAAALSRRLAAASQALVLGRLYNAGGADAAVSIDDHVGDCSLIGATDMEEMVASLIAEPPHELHLHCMHACR
jgi:hypothetical protein